MAKIHYTIRYKNLSIYPEIDKIEGNLTPQQIQNVIKKHIKEQGAISLDQVGKKGIITT